MKNSLSSKINKLNKFSTLFFFCLSVFYYLKNDLLNSQFYGCLGLFVLISIVVFEVSQKIINKGRYYEK